ncbi:MAG TPA: protein translocase subunit SecD [Gammaproteobacteria bacterium]
MNRYPSWVNWMVLVIMVVGTLLALPNAFPDDPAVHITRADGEPIEATVLDEAGTKLREANIAFSSSEIEEGAAIIRFGNFDDQLRANDLLGDAFPAYTVAQTLAPRTPEWVRALGLRPMALGLDLRGGVQFLFQVDLDGAIRQFLGVYETDLRTKLREENIRNEVRIDGQAMVVSIFDPTQLPSAERLIRALDDDGSLVDRIIVTPTEVDGRSGFRVELAPVLLRERQDFAIQQNTVTLRNRVNELGVAEAIVQRQGLDRILVELPGIQDPAQAKRVLNATATLEYHPVDMENSAVDAAARGRAPIGTKLAYDRDGNPVLLRREVIVTGDQVTDATPGYDRGVPAVFVNLNAAGAERMLDFTSQNVGRYMAVLFIEEKLDLKERDGEQVIETKTTETVISNAVIQGVFSSRFQTSGSMTSAQAQDLALLLRAGALATPIVQVREGIIGPSLGRDNIERGWRAVLLGFALVVVFMAVYYRTFGWIANIALLANVVLLVGLMSLIQAVLTMPGIAGIVLTVGMAVDANVLIYERIREELRVGNSPQASIRAGFEKAFSAIADGNITTLIAGIVLFWFGTGPIKGFAVTLSLGIITSMFTAIVGARVIVNLLYGRRHHIEKLSIGGRVSNATA